MGTPSKPPVGEDAEAPGWMALSAAFAALYPDVRPLSWGPDGLHRSLDMRPIPEHPLDGVEVYDAGDFWHFVSFGLSELYTKQRDDAQVSGFGYEFTLRVAKRDHPARPPAVGISLLVSMARTVYAGHVFAPFATVATGGFLGTEDGPTGLLIAEDPDLPLIEGPFGTVRLLTLVMLSDPLLQQTRGGGAGEVLDALRSEDPRLISRLAP